MGSSTPALTTLAIADAPGVAPGQLLDLARRHHLTPLTLGGRRLLPIVQGGMGVGV